MALETSIVDAYAISEDIFQRRPAVTFLAKRHGEVVLTIFTTAFTRDREVMSAEQFQSHVGNVLGTLRDAGRRIPTSPVRDLCADWVAEGWLFHDTAPDGGGVYFLTSASKDTIAWTAGLSHRRMVSATRVSAILDAIEDMANAADPNRESAIARIEHKIAKDTAELERLKNGAELHEVTLDEFVQMFDHISGLMATIPADFRSVAEDFTVAKRRILERILTGEDPAGQIMAQASTDALRVTQETPPGRAFEGVVDLLRDASTVADLRRHITRIMAHEFAEGLTMAERASFADIAAVFTGNVEAVLDGPRKISIAVDGALERHVIRRESRAGVDEAIRAARAALLAYPGRSIPEGVVPGLPRIEMPSVVHRLHDPRPIPPPRLLADVPASTAEPISEEETWRWGGPHTAAVRDHLDEVLTAADEPVTISRVWELAPDGIRRAVELVAYFDQAHRRSATEYSSDAIEKVVTRAPNGSERVVAIPLVTLRAESSDDERT